MTPAKTPWPYVTELVAQERDLRWPSFDEEDAWRLGVALVQRARGDQLPVAIDVRLGDHHLFHAALAGSSPDNDAWLVRKARVVARFHKSSLHMGQIARDAGQSLEEMFQLPKREYAAHGGAFPIHVDGVGVIGSVAVSGLPQLEDHALVVEILRKVLSR